MNWFLILLTIAGVTGALAWLVSRRKGLHWDLIVFLGIALLVPWALALMRGSPDFLAGKPLYPWARYAFPGILPTALLLCAGWWQWMSLLANRVPLSVPAREAIFLGTMLAISALAMLNAIHAFHSGLGVSIIVLLLILCQIAIFRWSAQWSKLSQA